MNNPASAKPLSRKRQDIAAGPGDEDFEAAHGESLASVLDLDTWGLGEDLLSAYGRLEKEVADALEQEDRVRKAVREQVFDKIRSGPYAPYNAGLHQAKLEDIEKIHKGLLFNGGVEACDGTNIVHDTLPLTITQIVVTTVAYSGSQGSWTHRLFRRDLRTKVADPVAETLAILEKRESRESQGIGDDSMSELARRGIMAYAERAILKDKSTALWRMGHGSPAPYELLTGLWASQGWRMRKAIDLIKWYTQYKRFVFIPSAPRKRHWLTIGNALKPMEYVILQTLEPEIERMIETGGYRENSSVKGQMNELLCDVAPHLIVGLYRVWEGAPPYLFYAHEEQAQMAVHIAMADSLMQEHRGFPMLIDLADIVCRSVSGADSFTASVQMAYTEAGRPFQYLAERETRYR